MRAAPEDLELSRALSDELDCETLQLWRGWSWGDGARSAVCGGHMGCHSVAQKDMQQKTQHSTGSWSKPQRTAKLDRWRLQRHRRRRKPQKTTGGPIWCKCAHADSWDIGCQVIHDTLLPTVFQVVFQSPKGMQKPKSILFPSWGALALKSDASSLPLFRGKQHHSSVFGITPFRVSGLALWTRQ